jgi:transketolase
MRTETIDALVGYCRRNPDVMLLTADLGYSVLERFAEALPDQYANVGVCEQAMVGIAAGLALAGRRVVTYSIANFPTMRCLEQLRNDVCYHDLPVVVIAVGGGFAYGAQGYTHHGIEDLSVMSMLPNMAVTCAADPVEATALLTQLLDRRRPGYLRLGRAGEPVLHDQATTIELGRAIWLRRGADIALLATGPIAGRAVGAADHLAHGGISASVASFHTWTPFDGAAVRDAASNHRAILTLEEHSVDGGFGSRVAEALVAAGKVPRFGKFGVTAAMRGLIGSQSWLIDRLGAIEDHARALL